MAMRYVATVSLSELSSTSQDSVMTQTTLTETDVLHTVRKNVVTIAQAARGCKRIRVTPVVAILSVQALKPVTTETRLREMAAARHVV